MSLNKQSGMTLTELLIAVAIVGILGAVAYPSYTNYVVQSKRSEAQREIILIANKMEQYFADHRTYTTDMKALGLSADPYITETGNYSIDAVVPTAGTFTLTATAKGNQASADSACTTLVIDHTGKKTAKSDNCWEK